MKKTLVNRIIFYVTISLLILFLIVSTCFAWFMRDIKTPSIIISTGDIHVRLTVYEYDSTSSKLTKLVNLETGANLSNEFDYDRGSVDVELPPYSVGSFDGTTPKTLYFLVEKLENSIDIDYSISFELEGFSNDVEHIGKVDNNFAGGFSFGATPISSSFLGNGVENGKLSSGEDLNHLEKVLLEYCNTNHNEISNIEGTLCELNKYVPEDNLIGSNNFDFFRFDVLMNDSSLASEYTSRTFKINANLLATQLGALTEEERVGVHYYVDSALQLEQTLSIYQPGDSIHIQSSFAYSKDLVFNRPVRLLVNGKTLEVNGNVIISYNIYDEQGSIIDTTGGGKIIVSQVGNTGGIFKINTPNSKITFVGTNSDVLGHGDINIQKDFFVNASYQEGLVINGSRIYSTSSDGQILDSENSYKDIILQDKTRIEILQNTKVGKIITDANNKVEKVRIINRGVIKELELSAMDVNPLIVDDFQIYVYNNGTIISNIIILPVWSTTSNTKIIQGFLGDQVEITGPDDGFNNNNIEKEGFTELVEEINGNPYNLLVHYSDVYDSSNNRIVHSLDSILEEHYNKKLAINNDLSIYQISSIKEITIVTSSGKEITFDDYATLRKMKQVEKIDLSDSTTYKSNVTISNVTYNYAVVPQKAFENLTNLSEVLLPGNTQYLFSLVFSSTNVKEVHLPSSLIAMYGYGIDERFEALRGVKYAHISSPTRLQSMNYGTTTVSYFVDEVLLSDYYSYFTNDWMVYPEAYLDASKNYFIRKHGRNNFEIVKYIGNDELSRIGFNDIYEVGEIDPIRISSLGPYSFYGKYRSGNTEIEFSDNIENISSYAFYQGKIVGTLNCLNLKSVGSYAFAQTTISKINCPNLTIINENAFNSCSSLTEVNLSLEKGGTIDSKAFASCNNMLFLESGAQIIGASAFSGCSRLVFVSLPYCKNIGTYSFYSISTLKVLITGKVAMSYDSSFNVSGRCLMIVNDLDEYGDTFKYYSTKNVIGNNEVLEKYSFSSFHNLGNYSIDDLYLNNGINILDVHSINDFINCDVLFVVDKNENKSVLVSYIASSLGSSGEDFSIVDGITIDEIVYPLTDISSFAFSGINITCDTLIFPDSLIKIDQYSFTNTGVKVFDTIHAINLKYIGSYAFYKSKLKYLNLPNAIEIGSYAFCNNTELTEVVLSSSNEGIIKSNAFQTCTNLEYVESGTNKISNNSFNSCSNLKILNLPHLKSIGINALCYCTSLELCIVGKIINIQDSLNTAFVGALSNNPLIVINDKDTGTYDEVPSRIFNNFSIVFSNDLKNELGTPNAWINLEEYTIDDLYYDNGVKLTNIHSIADYGDPSYLGIVDKTLNKSHLVSFVGPKIEDNDDFSMIDSFEIDNVEYNIVKLCNNSFSNVSINAQNVFIPRYVEEIGVNAFRNLKTKNVNEYKNTENVVSIGTYAFYGNTIRKAIFEKASIIGSYAFGNNSRLEEVRLSMEDKGTLGTYAFNSCGNLSYVQSGANVIGNNCFASLGSLKVVNMPHSKYIGNYAFLNSSKLNLVILGKVVYVSTRCLEGNGSNFVCVLNENDSDYPENYYNDCIISRLVTNDAIPYTYKGNVISTRNYRFDDYYLDNGVKLSNINSINDVVGASSIVAIDKHELDPYGTFVCNFSSSYGSVDTPYNIISSVSIVDGENTYVYPIRKINENAFRFDTIKTSNLVFNENIIEIGANAFADRSSSVVKMVTLNNVEIIRSGAFSKNSSWIFPNDPTFLQNVTVIENNAFQNCSGIVGELILGENLLEIGNNAFHTCTQLTSISAPNVITIGNSSFYNCSNLKRVDMPSVTSIGFESFRACNALEFVNLPSLLSLNYRAFLLSNAAVVLNFGSLNYIYDRETIVETSQKAPGVLILNGTSTSPMPGAIFNTSRESSQLYGLTFTSKENYPNYAGKVHATRYVSLPEGVKTEDLVFYSQSNSSKIDYLYAETSKGIILIYCLKPILSSIELNQDIQMIEEETNKPVYSIGEKCFYFTNISGNLTINENIKYIGDNAFNLNVSGKTNVISVLDTNNVERLGNNAFSGNRINQIILGEKIEFIGNNCFSSNSSLTSVNLLRNDLIDGTSYLECLSTSNNFNSSAKLYVYKNMFDAYYYNQSFGLIPSSNIEFFESEFEYAGYKFYLVDNGDSYELSSIITLDLSNETLVIPDSFGGKNITRIKDKAFRTLIDMNASITSIALPTYLEEFEYDFSLFIQTVESFNISLEAPNFCSIDGVLYDKEQTRLILFPISKKGNDSNEVYRINISSVVSVTNYAIYGSKYVRVIVLN